MLSYFRNSLGGIVGSCTRDKDLCHADQLTAALMSQLRLAESGIRRLQCQHQQQQRTLSFCCVPTGCKRYLESPIRPDDCVDAVRVVCSNQECSVSRWMHADCFRDWERLMMVCMKSCVAGDRGNGLVKRQDLELALKACVCLCSKGYVRKDLAYYETQDCVGNSNSDRTKHHQHPQQQQLRWKAQDRTQGCCRKAPVSSDADQAYQVRERTFSFSSTGSSPTSSTATPPPTSPRRSDERSPTVLSRSTTPAAEVTSQSTATTTSGNIFRHRCDLSAFRVLPKTVRNSYHIKVEDDGPHGNDKIRSFLLTNLTRNRIRQVHCAVCACALPIFDEFPLIDGTFFLSPRRYNDDNMCVVFERRMVFLNAVCLGCLDGSSTRLLCRGCLAPWDGSSLILGTMYSYDVFGAMSCCRSRLSCSGCQGVIEEPQNLRFFSDYSRLTRCPQCQLEEYHFLKPLKDIFFFKTC